MATGYSPPDYRDQNDTFGQDWSGNMTIRDDSLAAPISATVSRVDKTAITNADMTVDQFQIIPGTSGYRTAFRVTNSGQVGIAYKVTLQVLTANGVTLFRAVQIPSPTG